MIHFCLEDFFRTVVTSSKKKLIIRDRKLLFEDKGLGKIPHEILPCVRRGYVHDGAKRKRLFVIHFFQKTLEI